jgi:hypothetical protein
VSAPRFLADEDFHFRIVQAIRRLEPKIQIATVVEIGHSGASDADVLELANADNWLVVSHDVNSMKHAAEGRIREGHQLTGLFLAHQTSAIKTVAESLVLIWAASQAEVWENQIVFLPL